MKAEKLIKNIINLKENFGGVLTKNALTILATVILQKMKIHQYVKTKTYGKIILC